MLIEPPCAAEKRLGRRPVGMTTEAAHIPAAGLAGSELADRFCFWRGRSGRRYVCSTYRLGFDLDAVPRYADAVVVATRRGVDGARIVLDIGVTGGFPDLSPVLSAALGGRRADELHVHLLAGTPAERQAVVDDLAGAASRVRSRD